MSSDQTKTNQDLNQDTKTRTIMNSTLDSKTTESVKILTIEHNVNSSAFLSTRTKDFNFEMKKLTDDGYKLCNNIRITVIGDVIIYTAVFKKKSVICFESL
jgi:hypothetical protein